MIDTGKVNNNMSHLSTILNRIKEKRMHYRRFPEPSGLTTDPDFLYLIRNTQEYQATWTDYTEEEADAANILFERYKEYLKPNERKMVEQLRRENIDYERAELAHMYPVFCGAVVTRFLVMGTNHKTHRCSLPYGHKGKHKCGDCLGEWADEATGCE